MCEGVIYSANSSWFLILIDAGFLGGRAEEVEDDGFFECFGAVGDVWGQDDGLAADEECFVLGLGVCFPQQELDAA